jgi:hypothetical protein
VKLESVVSGSPKTTPFFTMTTTSFAGYLGRIVGTTARVLITLERQIDWGQVSSVVLQGLKVLVVLTYLAGQATRKAWDALPKLSERLGRFYSSFLVASEAPPAPELKVVPSTQPQPSLDLQGLTQRQLMVIAGTRRKLAKHQLIEMVLAA